MTYTPIPRGTQNWDVPLNAALSQLDANITSSSSTALQAANNLSDLTNAPQARINLGLTGLANALSNMTATTNPAVTSDNTQGYSLGSTWFNTTTNSMFVATSVATGAAVWLQIPPTFVDRTTSQSIAGVKTFTSTLQTTGSHDSIRAGATNSSLTTSVTGDAQVRLNVRADGLMEWGSGSATRDTNLYRGAVNLLQTDDSFSAAVTTTGTATPAANFTLTSANFRATCGVQYATIVLSYTGTTITADAAGNITDTLCVTLSPAPPAATVIGFDKSGVACGSATIATNGQVTLKSLSSTATIASGNSINFTAVWL